MGLLKKIQMLKNGLMALICINILVLGTSLFATYNYYQSKHQLEVQWTEKQALLMDLHNLESEILRLTLGSSQSVDEQYEHRRDSDRLREKILSLGDSQLNQEPYLKNAKEWRLNLSRSQTLVSRFAEIKRDTQTDIQNLIHQSSRASSQAAIVGVLTLIFGIILPLLITYFLSRALLQAKRSYEEMVAQWITKYLQEWRTAGDKPFQDPFFWMNLVITTIEIFGPQSKHPAMQVLSEFAPVIKREINKRAS